MSVARGGPELARRVHQLRRRIMTKHEMVRKLVTHSVDIALHENQCDLLQTLFEKGFTGFNNMPRERLETEMRLRGIISFQEPDEEFDSDDAFASSEADVRTLLAGAACAHSWNHYFD
jgi:hypothetical protein